MAETIDLTPQSPEYSLIVRVGGDSVTVTPSADGNTIINPPSVAMLISGATDHIAIDFDVVEGIGGVFKKPPFVLNCELRGAMVNSPAIIDGGEELPLADFTDYVILTPDGRIYFKPSFLGAIKRAISDSGAPSSIGIDVTAMPVYKNPSGESPEYDATYFTIYLNMQGIELSALAPADWAETNRWIEYIDSTTLTPAGIGALTGE